MTSRAFINPLPKNSDVSLRATIQNPRPRKYASDADRQKAFRERQAVIQVRVAPKAVETFDEIAETLGYSRQEVVYALLMKGLMSLGNWETVGLPIDWQKKMPQFKLPRYEENPTMRKATPAQLAARERFAEMARSGAFKRRKNPAKKTVSQKISQLTREGYPQRQAVAIALNEERKGKVKRNPISDIGQTIYQQLGANRFAAMTGSKNFVAGDDYLMFSIPRNASVFNKVRITLTPDDLYKVDFMKVSRMGEISKSKAYDGLYADQLRDFFTSVTGMQTSLGTMGRRNNPSEREERKPRVVLITNPKAREAKKQRMLNISWLTPGGAREMKSVPIDFTFTHYVGDVAEKFFVRTENGQLIVSEYATGGKIGQVPYTMRAAALNDRAAAKMYVGEMLSRIGAERFNKAVKSFPAIN